MVPVLFLSLLVCLLFTAPIAVSLALGTVAAAATTGSASSTMTMLAQAMVTTSDSFVLMAVPFFMLVGTLMDRSGIAKRLINVAEAITGSTVGGLGTTTIVAAMFFAAISGSGPAVVAALGVILIPAMIKRGYNREYSAAVVASAATIGPVIPPSIPMIVYGVTAGVSVSSMFLGGIVPGIIMGLALILVNYFISKKRRYIGVPRGGGLIWVLKRIGVGIPALLMPALVLGGIYTGFVTPTESAIVGVFYSLIVGKFFYKELTWPKLKDALVEAGKLTAPVMFLLGGAITFGRLLTLQRIPETLANWMLGITDNGILILLMIMIFLLITGMFIDTTSNIILFAPLFCPIVAKLGYNLVFFGVLMTINLCIGFLTPPLGMNLFVAQGISGSTLEGIVKQNMPFLLVLVAVLMLVMLFPQIVTFLPSILNS